MEKEINSKYTRCIAITFIGRQCVREAVLNGYCILHYNWINKKNKLKNLNHDES
jgi:hypothetical protein